MFLGAFRKTIGLFFIAFAAGLLLTIILPVWGWIAIIAVSLAILGITWLFC